MLLPRDYAKPGWHVHRETEFFVLSESFTRNQVTDVDTARTFVPLSTVALEPEKAHIVVILK